MCKSIDQKVVRSNQYTVKALEPRASVLYLGDICFLILSSITLLPPVLYFQHAHFIPIVGVGKRGAYQLVHGDLPRQHSFGATSRFTGPVPADSRQ